MIIIIIIIIILFIQKMKTRRGIVTNVHEYNGTLFGKPALFKMTSVNIKFYILMDLLIFLPEKL